MLDHFKSSSQLLDYLNLWIPHAHGLMRPGHFEVELEGTCWRGRQRSGSIDELRDRRGYGRAGRGAIMHDDDEDLLD